MFPINNAASKHKQTGSETELLWKETKLINGKRGSVKKNKKLKINNELLELQI